MADQEINFGTDDLQVVAKVIAAGSQRGMFRPEELVPVGNVYNKIMLILEAHKAVPEEMQAPAEEAEAEETEEKTDD